jgi:cysteinyl-tRNA synthetase
VTVSELIALREQSRESKDYQQADLIRQQLFDIGVIVEDTFRGSRTRVKRSYDALPPHKDVK